MLSESDRIAPQNCSSPDAMSHASAPTQLSSSLQYVLQVHSSWYLLLLSETLAFEISHVIEHNRILSVISQDRDSAYLSS